MATRKYVSIQKLGLYDDKIKNYTDTAVNSLSTQVAYIDTEDNENIEDVGASNIVVDSVLSTTSTNPVQNKVVTNKINQISQEISEKITKPNTAIVGQVLAVKSVDEDGKPTEWETVYMKTAEGENDNTEPEKIENIGVKNGGAFTAYTGKSVTVSVELYVSFEDYVKNGWIYGAASTRPIALYVVEKGESLRGSTNVGDYSYVDFPYKQGDKVHIVFTTYYETNTCARRSIYVNGVLLKTAEATEGHYLTELNDTFFVNEYFSTISLYQKRIWERELTESEAMALFNDGKPQDYVLTDENKVSLVSDMNKSGITENGWIDSQTENVIELADGFEIIKSSSSSTGNSNSSGSSSSTGNSNSSGSSSSNGNSSSEEVVNPIVKNIYPDFTYDATLDRAPHDCTFIGDDYVTFNQPSDGGSVHYYNPTTWEKSKKITVKITEANGRYLQNKSVDYKFGKLLIGNGRAIASDETSYLQQGAKLYVFHEAESWKEMPSTTDITFENCGAYDVIDIASLGYKVYGFWGASEDLVYVSCNLFNDIYLIQLGRGSTNLGSGAYVQADDTRYNGSFRIIKKWHQDNGLGTEAGHGGQFYKGHLYIATNNIDVCKIYRCNLNEDGTLTFDALDFLKYDSDYPKTLACRYIDGMCIKDGILYAQPLITGNNVYSSYKGIIKCDLANV